MKLEQEIDNLESAFDELSNKVGRVQGEVSLMKENYEKTRNLIDKYTVNKENYKKAVEVLSLVQQITRDKIKDNFETLVTYALRFIYSDDYSFSLEFGRRGNLSELDFNIKTPDFEEACDPLDSSGGGVLNIVSVALRAVLLEVAVPKIEGFVLMDESFANLSKEYLENASLFLKELNKKLNRQIIMISHQSYFKENCDNLIEIKG